MNERVNWINEINDGINEFYVYFVKYIHYIKHTHALTQPIARWESTYLLKDLSIIVNDEKIILKYETCHENPHSSIERVTESSCTLLIGVGGIITMLFQCQPIAASSLNILY